MPHSEELKTSRPFVCIVKDCEKTYTRLSHLRRHKILVHEKGDEVLCTIPTCGRSFNNRYALKKHLNTFHEQKPFQCKKCEQSFARKRKLKEHSFIHTGIPLYKCDICEMQFTNNYGFQRHKSNHKTYKCECGIVFHKWTLICKHKRTDCPLIKTSHVCTVCNKVFTQKVNLHTHSLSHKNEREPFKCIYEDCDRSYLFKKNLTYHIKVFHEQVDRVRYPCTQPNCKQSFVARRNLKNHIQKLHTNKKPAVPKPRKPRKDKGTIKPNRKKPMSEILSGYNTSVKEQNRVEERDSPVESMVPVRKRVLVATNVPIATNVSLKTKVAVKIEVPIQKRTIGKNELRRKRQVPVTKQVPVKNNMLTSKRKLRRILESESDTDSNESVDLNLSETDQENEPYQKLDPSECKETEVNLDKCINGVSDEGLFKLCDDILSNLPSQYQ